MAALVLDCSMTVAWLLEDEQPQRAANVLDRVVEEGAVVPTLWPLEVGNALLVAERRGRLSTDHRIQALRDLSALPITLDDETAGRAWRETMGLAETHELTLYDAAYLELALRRGFALATLDKPLRNAAGRVGVFVFTG